MPANIKYKYLRKPSSSFHFLKNLKIRIRQYAFYYSTGINKFLPNSQTQPADLKSKTILCLTVTIRQP